MAAVLIPLIILKSFFILYDVALHWLLLTCYTAAAAVLAIAFFVSPRLRELLAGSAYPLLLNILMCFGVCGTVAAFQYGLAAWQALKAPAVLAYDTIPRRRIKNEPRIIWLVLDELSYEQVYGKRFPGLSLPAFDALASESTSLTSVVPAGDRTSIVMPALMTGVSTDAIRIAADGDRLSLHEANLHAWKDFDENNTVFQDARARGYKTAVAGWYNPYCDILPHVLDRCFWTFSEEAPNRMWPGSSTLVNAIYPWLSLFKWTREAFPKLIPTTNNAAQRHILDYQKLLTQGNRFLKDKDVNFVLIHMAVPHPAGIYNRALRDLTGKGGSYLDNLALADAYLAQTRSLLEQEGEWDSSTVIVMGDHSWRTKQIWSKTPEWTAEEQVASNQGSFDDRPAYIIKLPQQKEAHRVDTRFSAVDTRLLVKMLMQDRSLSPARLASWLQRHSDSQVQAP